MREAPKWFDRTFEVPYSVELLPQLHTRLRGSPARLEETVRSSSRERMTAKVDGRWSAQENAGHLLDLEPLWLARVSDYAAGANVLTPSDLTNCKTDDANHNVAPLEQILADYRAARQSLMTCVEALDESWFVPAIPHPRLGTPMRLADHLHFVAEHDDHHLARIWALVNRLS